MPTVTDVRVWGSDARRDVELGRPGPPIDGSGCVLVPSFVDLCCEAGFPGFPAREDPASLAAAALAGGFGDLVVSPAVDPVVDTPEHLAEARRVLAGGVRAWPAAACTRGLEGAELSEIGLLVRAGICALSDGGVPLRDSVVLRNLLEYARGFGVTTFLRPADPDLDALGVVHESELAAQLGMRGNPASSEEIGIARIVALVRATGADVHLTHLSTARGVAQVRAARAEGLAITASTPARSLLLDEEALDDGRYDSRFRLHPPLRSRADRDALRAAVRDGTLLLTADHRPRAPEEKDLEFERAVPGSTGLESAFAGALTALDGDLDAVVRALAVGPRDLLSDRAAAAGDPGRSSPRAAGWTLVDTDAVATVRAAEHRSRARNDALDGRELRGVVRACFPAAWVAA